MESDVVSTNHKHPQTIFRSEFPVAMQRRYLRSVLNRLHYLSKMAQHENTDRRKTMTMTKSKKFKASLFSSRANVQTHGPARKIWFRIYTFWLRDTARARDQRSVGKSRLRRSQGTNIQDPWRTFLLNQIKRRADQMSRRMRKIDRQTGRGKRI